MKNAVAVLRKNTMLIVLVLVFLFFTIMTNGQMFEALNFNALITQNAYVYILATGMLMCMLTGGNIDLACGSFVCFIGAMGGIFMVVKGMNPFVAVVLMMGIGVIYGCILGFLIAYLNVPPWIATLAGFLAFRGLGTALLSANSSTGSIAPFPSGFLDAFSGKIFSSPIGQINVVCITVGIIASIIVVVLNVMTRANKLKKGYEADSMTAVIIKSVLSVAVIMLFAYKLAKAGGIPTVLVWVAAVSYTHLTLPTKA